MKNFKLIGIILSLVLCIQGIAFAAEAETTVDVAENIQTASIQPRGRYLQGGGCSITPYTGYVEVSGHTDPYDYADEVTVELTIFKEISSGCWLAIWTDSVTEYDSIHTGYPLKKVTVDSGYNYKVEGTHTVKHNGVTETNYSETAGVYVN